MIYCRLKGGLGNMMFQIAAAKAFALDLNTDCAFPNLVDQLTVLDNDMHHNPELKHSSEYMKVFGGLRTDPIPESHIHYQGFPFHFQDTKILVRDAVIDGFFQSEKYFVRHRDAVLDMFDFSFVNNELINQKYPFLHCQGTTSIHVRRGDYVRNPACHPPQSIEYYKRGMKLLDDITDLYIVFSDDIQWCKENLEVHNIHFIENEKDYVEIYLMSLCKNNITCNSSFSWWGAWMNRNPNKVVVGPRIWFGPNIGHSTDDILPERWLKV